MNTAFAILLCVIGVFDLWLASTKRATISEVYQTYFPTWVDLVLMLIFLTTLYFYLPLNRILTIMLAAIFGHLFWPNKERHI